MPIMKRTIISASIAITSLLVMSLLPLYHHEAALADPAKLSWSIVDTPADGQSNSTIITNSEVSTFAAGTDGFTFYAVDIPNSRILQSLDGGITWPTFFNIDTKLLAAGANLPVWNIAMAPDNPAFIAVVTDGNGAPNGPKRVFISDDNGATWSNSNLIVNAAEYVSSIDISMRYSDMGRDIVIGTRNNASPGTGRILILKVDNFTAGWQNQPRTPAGNVGDVVALKFSPSYTSDQAIAVLFANNGGTFLTLGTRDVVANTTAWSATQVEIKPDSSPAGSSPNANQIVTADLELPSDFVGTLYGSSRFYISYDDINLTGNAGVYRVDGFIPYRITPPTTGRISSIAYWGTHAEGKLATGEVTTDPTLPFVNVWRCSDPLSNAPNWQRSDEHKSPTGGANWGYANAQLAWSVPGNMLYCGTSSASPSAGGTGINVADTTRWPGAWNVSVFLDESAFSISPYTYDYEYDLIHTEHLLDTDVGEIWNQTGLIDTEISYLSDIEALEAPVQGTGYPVRYLASISDNTSVALNFDSVWRTTSDSVGRTWERIACLDTGSDSAVLRVNPRSSEDVRSRVLAFAAPTTTNMLFSPDEGQTWQLVYPGIPVTDLSLASNGVMYLLSDSFVKRGERGPVAWTWTTEIDTTLNSGHTISTPLENPKNKEGNEQLQDWIAVGDAESGYVVYADFSAPALEFKPSIAARDQVPLPGRMHVIFDDKFQETKIIYAGSNDIFAGTSGKIYRWTVGVSATWDELDPPNDAFYGLAQGNDVLYGLWNTPAIAGTLPGADRTLYPRAPIPPAIEWDDLTEGLPAAPGTVSFTREPTSLKISVGQYNTLWAIDDKDYDPFTNEGCLWAYTDTMAIVGPWSTAPASGDLIPVDPVSGRATEVNFAWDQVDYATMYELQIAKDEDFLIRVLSSENITPVDQTAPAVYFPAGGLSPTPASAIGVWGNLESGHDYYWRVRASRAVTGEIIRSLWSATMYFTIKAGVPTIAKDIGLTLLKPNNGERNVTITPSFSWSPFPRTSSYEFILAKNPDLADPLVKATVSETAYEHDELLEPGTVYFWQVRALKPSPSEPSPVATFTTITTTIQPEVAPKETKLPFWIWPVIGVYSLLIIAMIVFAYMKPSLFEPASKRASRSTPGKPLSSTSSYGGGPAVGKSTRPQTESITEQPTAHPSGQPAEHIPEPPPAESVIELPPAQPTVPPPEPVFEPTHTQPQERISEPFPGQSGTPYAEQFPSQSGEQYAEQFEEPHRFVEQPKPKGESHPIIEKIKSPFVRIAESVSPSYRQRHYLEELEDKGIIEPMQQTIEETPGESLTTRLKNNLLDRFKKKGIPENEGDLE